MSGNPTYFSARNSEFESRRNFPSNSMPGNPTFEIMLARRNVNDVEHDAVLITHYNMS